MLNHAQELLCVASGILVCAGVYGGTHPAALSIRYAACMALLFGVTLFAARAIALERSYEVRVLSPVLLLDAAVHTDQRHVWSLYRPTQTRPGTAMHSCKLSQCVILTVSCPRAVLRMDVSTRTQKR